MVTKLMEYGIREKQAREVVKKHDEDYILANIEVMEEVMKRKKIHSPPGFLMSAFEVDYRPKKTEHDRAQEEKLRE